MPSQPLYAVVMAGGSGTRFWPLSRAAKPKQFLSLASSATMLQETVERVAALVKPGNVKVVCGAQHSSTVRKLVPQVAAKHVVVEPMARNTAPAIALGLVGLPLDAVVVVLPADQHVTQRRPFERALRDAVALAKKGDIVTLGIRPTRPETGFGYIQMGEKKGVGHQVARFVEKPNLQTAQSYIASGQYLWNAGIFVFQVKTMREALARHCPDIDKALQQLDALALKKKLTAPSLKKHFEKMPSISIDYAVAEKASNMAVVSCDCGWSDVGSFNALAEVRSANAQGNILVGKRAMTIDATRSIVWSEKRVVAVVGVSDVVVVDTPDAVLVVHRDACQDVKKVVEALKAAKQSDVL
jgi:mannose-1-phosphate guanylyltransferase